MLIFPDASSTVATSPFRVSEVLELVRFAFYPGAHALHILSKCHARKSDTNGKNVTDKSAFMSTTPYRILIVKKTG
jgi:hypothetical protein